jgi:hypothetical protein
MGVYYKQLRLLNTNFYRRYYPLQADLISSLSLESDEQKIDPKNPVNPVKKRN